MATFEQSNEVQSEPIETKKPFKGFTSKRSQKRTGMSASGNTSKFIPMPYSSDPETSLQEQQQEC